MSQPTQNQSPNASSAEPPTNASSAAPTFRRLAVSRVRPLCPGAAEVTFEVPPGLRAAFAFRCGQHVAVRRLDDAGEELRRNYSITSSEGEVERSGSLSIGVRRLDGGRVSSWMVDEVSAGDELDVMTPHGSFGARLDPAARRHLLLVAGGSGITPLLSIVRSVLAGEPHSRVTLLYGNRETGSIMFRDDLDALKDQHVGRLAVLHFLSRERRNVPLLDGRIDARRLQQAWRAVLAGSPPGEAYLCGPEPMVAAVRPALVELGMPLQQVHVELFGTAASVPAPPRAADPSEGRVAAQATIVLHGSERVVEVLEGERVLDAARRAGLDVPFACTGGVCATCRAHVSGGAVEMVANYALDEAEVAAGYALTCQALPASAEPLHVDYDRP